MLEFLLQNEYHEENGEGINYDYLYHITENVACCGEYIDYQTMLLDFITDKDVVKALNDELNGGDIDEYEIYKEGFKKFKVVS